MRRPRSEPTLCALHAIPSLCDSQGYGQWAGDAARPEPTGDAPEVTSFHSRLTERRGSRQPGPGVCAIWVQGLGLGIWQQGQVGADSLLQEA